MNTNSNRLCLFAFEYPPVSGGIARLCGGIGEALQRDGINAHVLTQNGVTPIQDFGLPKSRVDSRRPLREWRAFQWLRHNLRTQTATRHTAVCGVWYPEGLIAYLAGVRRLVILAHGAELLPTLDRWRRPLWKALQKMVLEHADLVIANSDYTHRLVASSAPKARVETIPLAVDVERFAPGDKRLAKIELDVSGKIVLSTVARIHHYKAHDTVLRALAHLETSQRKQFAYLIAGRGPHEQQLKRLALELGIEEQVRWLGFVPEEDLPKIYRASDLFVLCTRDAPGERSVEGFGLAFLEAQACGTPVLGTRTGGIPAAIEEGEGGWLIEQDDVDSLAEILGRMISSPESFRWAGIQARHRILRESTWWRYGQRFSSALQRAGIGNG
jgi:phosphatidylinositol alpha-1,6-mannosyltransferase